MMTELLQRSCAKYGKGADLSSTGTNQSAAEHRRVGFVVGPLPSCAKDCIPHRSRLISRARHKNTKPLHTTEWLTLEAVGPAMPQEGTAANMGELP